MLNWNDFEIILAIHETGTLSAAARRLGMNQSSVSRILKRIEIDLKKQIFSNISGSYIITPEGQPFLRVGVDMGQAIANLKSSQVSADIKGIVRITTIEAIANKLLSHLSDFYSKYPQIIIELNGANRDVDLTRRSFHAAIRLGRETRTKSLLVKKLGQFEVAGYKRRDLMMNAFDWIGYESSLSSIPEEKWLREHTQKAKQRLHVGSYVAMEKAIEQGLGKGLLPLFMGEKNEKLEKASGSKPVLTREVWYISHPDFRQDLAVASFSKWLFSEYENIFMR